MTEDQKRIAELEQKLKEQAAKALIESKYFKESELKNYSAEQLQAMNDLLIKLTKGGQPARGAQPPKPNKPKEPVGRWFNSKTGKWEM